MIDVIWLIDNYPKYRCPKYKNAQDLIEDVSKLSSIITRPQRKKLSCAGVLVGAEFVNRIKSSLNCLRDRVQLVR